MAVSENDTAEGIPGNGATPTVLSLDGVWTLKPDRENRGAAQEWQKTAMVAATPEQGWQSVNLPGCWERDGLLPGTLTGPVWYRKDVPVPAQWRSGSEGSRLWWEMDAVSYHAEGWASGAKVGEHTGMWDAFAFEVPLSAVPEDGLLPLALRVEKPGGKAFPVRETMAGFLPYVWGTWGGPWQSSRLRLTGPVAIRGVRAPATAAGVVRAEVDVDIAPAVNPAAVRLHFQVRAADGTVVAEHAVSPEGGGAGEQTVTAEVRVSDPVLWEPHRPVLYTLAVAAVVAGGQVSDIATRRVGFRDVSVRDEQILLNGKPVFFRAPLSWGWYEDERAPNPDPQVFADELKRVRALGFNGMKLCLWIPPQSYFDIADAMGMLLWVELPMWLPEGTPFARKQTPPEYRRIVRQVGGHPSIALWTIGCEIGKGVDAEFLGALYEQVKTETKSPLVRDNSGSAECYGGPLPEHADYWDFHLYCDLPFARTTFDAFAPRWRERQPFLFGEFNDQDALRDLPGIIKERDGAVPWWAKDDKEFNPQGVRWEYNVVAQIDKMKRADLLRRADELRESSRKQALLNRKYTLELTRSYPFMTGYVVTGLVDTPISTAGIFDDFGNARFSAEEFTPFNADTVLFVEPDRRRAWTAGGDRPSYIDRFNVWAGDTVRRHVGVSHYGREAGPATLGWVATRADGKIIREGTIPVEEPIAPGDVREIGLIEFSTPPNVRRPEQMRLSLTLMLKSSGRRVVNSWPVWVYPKPAKNEQRRIGLYDPAGHLPGFAEAVGITPVPLSAATGEAVTGTGERIAAIVATAWRPEMLGYVRGGGRALLLQPGASEAPTGSGLPAEPMPFWREAMKLFEAHPSWGEFPHERWTDLQFHGLAGDAAFDLEKVQATLGSDARLLPALTRVDARSFALHGYTVEAQVGQGRLLMTTLRPQGGLGEQPSGLPRHVAGAYLLRTWLDWLASV